MLENVIEYDDTESLSVYIRKQAEAELGQAQLSSGLAWLVLGWVPTHQKSKEGSLKEF